MARAIWSGTLSFGLLQIPVKLQSGERRTDLHFRMLDSRDNTPIRYERVNSDTGEEVPWKDVVKAFEYRKGSYVVIEEEDLRAAAPQSHESVDVEAFVDAGSISPRHYEKPYVLVPGTKSQKGYVLLRETLAKAGKIGASRAWSCGRANTSRRSFPKAMPWCCCCCATRRSWSTWTTTSCRKILPRNTG